MEIDVLDNGESSVANQFNEEPWSLENLVDAGVGNTGELNPESQTEFKALCAKRVAEKFDATSSSKELYLLRLHASTTANPLSSPPKR